MTKEQVNGKGLTATTVQELQVKYGKNELIPPQKESLAHKIFHILCEPMFLLLFCCSNYLFLIR